MGFNGLKQFKEREAARATSNESVYFKLEQGQKVRLRPLVELDDEGTNFDPKKGTANFVTEYANPVKFWLSSVYDPEVDENHVGRDMVRKYGWYKQDNPDAEKNQHNDKTKNWNPKNRFYLPVVVDRLDGSDLTVEVLQLTYGPRSYSQAFVDFHEAKGSITDRWWDFSRNGKPGQKQQVHEVDYKLIPDDPSDFDDSEFEIPDVTDAPYVNHVPYESQAEFYQLAQTYPANTAVTAAVSEESPEADW